MKNQYLILEGPVSIEKSKLIQTIDDQKNYYLSFEVMVQNQPSGYRQFLTRKMK